MFSRMLTPEEIRKQRTKLMEGSTQKLQMKTRDIPATYRAAGTVLNYMKVRRLNLHEAIDSVVAEDQMKLIGDQVETLVRKTLDHEQEINYLIKEVKLLENNLDLDTFMVKILIAELLWGKFIIRFSSMDTIYVKYYEQDLKEAFVETAMMFDNIEDSYSSKLPVYVRINTLAISLEGSIDAFHKEGWNLLPRPATYTDYLEDVQHLEGKNYIRDFHIYELFVFPIGTSFYEHPGYLEGKLILQDKGSCLSTFLLNPKPGSHVLDMCAAPGNTTNHIANMIKNEGTIYACEKFPERYNKLCSQIDLTRSTCTKPIFQDCLELKINDLNYILIDAYSTYTGIFHKKDRSDINPVLRHNQFKSRTLLQYALQTFENVKRVVYASCSTFTDEGEKVIADALSRIGDSYTLLDVREMLWNEWMSVGITADHGVDYPFAEKCLRIRPESDLCQGYFIAVFERNFSVPVPPYVRKGMNRDANSLNKKTEPPKVKPAPKPAPKPVAKPVPTIKNGGVKKTRARKKKLKVPQPIQNPISAPSGSGFQIQYQSPPVFYSNNNAT